MEIHGPVFVMSLLILLLLLPTRTVATALYFPHSNVTLRLPYLNDERFPSDIRLINLRTLRNDSTIPTNVKYKISMVHEKMASIDPETNQVVLHSLPSEGVSEETILVLAKENASNQAALEIKIHPMRVNGKQINCRDHIQDMCFWNTSDYRIYENQPVTMIGTLGPNVYSIICPNFHIVGYMLLNGTEHFHIVNDTLYANASLDRDVVGPPGGPGPRASIQVRCVVWEEKTGIQHAPIKILDIDILDQDDNPPKMQGPSSIEIHLREFSKGAELDENNLILKDSDARSSNRYSVHVLGDTYDALNVTCDTVPIDVPPNVPSTMIFTRIYAKTTLLPKSPYRVILRVKDESLIPGHGVDTLNFTVSLYGPEHRTITTTMSPKLTRQMLSYPSNVKIARISGRYSRVAGPSSEPPPSLNFSIQGSAAFNITRRGGIVYVTDESLLKSENETTFLKIKWSGRDGDASSKAIRVNLINVQPSKINACNRSETTQRSCANAETPEECESSCGVGSGLLSKGNFVGQCAWRRNKRSNVSSMSEYYPTCSPDLAHCPDNKCDELEGLDPRICPQDCTIEPDVLFAHMNKGGRGIERGLGTCTCNDMLQCECNVHPSRARNDGPGKGNKEGREGTGKLRDRKNEVTVTGARKASSGPCGPVCMIGVIGASLFVVIVIVGIFITSRYRMGSKGARRDGKRTSDRNSNGVGILPSDYIDRGDGLLISLDTFTAANRHLLLPKTCPPDPKWEFPRSRLSIEQVLGEGEFGRVLRATAIDISGIPGATTVAVKTLKENACASELADLLSEYQLLKEVQHPNVIRLLGACTTSTGPVYLIIEFAEYGSLRNYLRRSRHLDSESRTTCSTTLSNASPNNAREELQNIEIMPTHTITPRDILSFAWQISKGMAYLAEIKLVHRDLAARNVLLATSKVCKISDFGLTRDVYEDDAYLKRSKGRVPVKWMAPESLADHVYTSKSDVWSFGILLWELVTLGASPYPGVDVHNLYNLLKAGYRMERPANCSQQLYKLMVSCWHQEPGMRPSFKELACHWERMLEDGVEYLDLNPRTVHNQAYFASLHALDSPNSSGNDVTDNGTVNILRTDVVNYLGKPSSDTVTKCDKVDKLHALWQQPIASFPEEPIKFSYVNDRPPNLNINHYESPIKFRNTSVTSNSENDLATPSNERPQSYIDMEGKKPSETEDLLVFGSMDSRNYENKGN